MTTPYLLPALLAGSLVAAAAAAPTQDADAPHADLAENEQLESAGINGRFMLQNQYGEIITDQELHGTYPLITFGYTHCPDICPTTLAEMVQILNLLGDDAERVQPVFVTVDPKRDTPRHLGEYVGWFHPRMIGLTGSEALVARAAANFKVRYRKVHEPGDPPDKYAMDHSAGIYLMGPDGRFLEKFAYAAEPADMAERVRARLK